MSRGANGPAVRMRRWFHTDGAGITEISKFGIMKINKCLWESLNLFWRCLYLCPCIYVCLSSVIIYASTRMK